ncbi:Na+/H+ antiporter NhaA [Pseudomonas gingeri]|uniref:Na(+)/H(+) antiporter NhaA n=1 Tax=Pseudomonas gingeri TaxID=117681 RepID=A0A7Y7X799_9PSED|nr:Na+/H+ antiporter NhaA [Pseudomonas gingeri]NWB94595.1 Na+/H+ antiporter NhaA [Pseudomonas gingeri]NWD73307.1 Na+/H+ antiporter NhaA [Pseudomonas gingeri]
MPLRSTFTRFFQLEAAGGLLLIAAAALALIINNSPLSHLYAGLLDVPVVAQVGALQIAKPLLLWINDGLMALFFLLIGLEVKRELLEGHLSKPSQVVLPGAAAIGGMVVPALIYWFLNRDNPAALGGWAIPMATDIAFALGVLALLGKRVPVSLKLFLMTLAIIDDLGAIIVIAIFYSHELSTLSLALAGTCLVALIAMNRLGVVKLGPYMVIGLILWICVLKSGVHATLAGVTLAFCIPLRTRNAETSPLLSLEHALHPWVAFGILPLFAFANAGVSLTGVNLESFTHHVPMGIAAGLLIGKTVGVFGLTWLAVRAGLAALPQGANWGQVLAVAILCGIGFTMSLFVGSLAFVPGSSDYVGMDRMGILTGSILAALIGYAVMAVSSRKPGAT